MKNIFIIRPALDHEAELRRQIDNDDEEEEVDQEQGKVIPWIEAIKVLKQMKLPVYFSEEGEYQCHFRDVIKKLSRRLLDHKNKPVFEVDKNEKPIRNKEGHKF